MPDWHVYMQARREHGENRRAIAQALRDVTKLRGEIVPCAIGSLPNDGKVIEDARSYQ